MKAKEYFKKYHEGLVTEAALGQTDTFHAFLAEFHAETVALMKKRNCTTDSMTIATIEDQNKKWNKIARMIHDADGSNCLKYDGYVDVIRRKIPKLDLILKMKQEVKDYEKQLELFAESRREDFLNGGSDG